jgi:hypothetical protein
LFLLIPIFFAFFDGIRNEIFVSATESIFGWEGWFYSSGLSMYLFGSRSYLSADPSIFIGVLDNLDSYSGLNLFTKIDFLNYTNQISQTNWSTFDSLGIRLNTNRVYIDYVDHGMSIFNFLSFKIFGPIIGAPYLFLYSLILVSITITYFLIKNNIVILELGFMIICYFLASTIFLQYSKYFVASPVTYRFIGIIGIFPLIYLFNIKNISKISFVALTFWTSVQVGILIITLIVHSQSNWQIIALVLFLAIYGFFYSAQRKYLVTLLGSIIFIISLISIFTSTVPSSPEQVKTRLIWHSVFMGLNALPERQIDGINLGRERGVYEDWNAFEVGYEKIPEVDSWRFIFGNTKEYEHRLRVTIFQIIEKDPLILFRAFFYKFSQFSSMLWNFVFDFIFKDSRTIFILFYSIAIFSLSKSSLVLYRKEFYVFILTSVFLSTFVVTFVTYPQVSNTIQSITLFVTLILFAILNFVYRILKSANE